MKHFTEFTEWSISVGPFLFRFIREILDDPIEPEFRHDVTSNMALPNDDPAWIAVSRSTEAWLAASADAGVDVKSEAFRKSLKNYLWRMSGIEISEIEQLKAERDTARRGQNEAVSEYLYLLTNSLLERIAQKAEHAHRSLVLFGGACIEIEGTVDADK